MPAQPGIQSVGTLPNEAEAERRRLARGLEDLANELCALQTEQIVVGSGRAHRDCPRFRSRKRNGGQAIGVSGGRLVRGVRVVHTTIYIGRDVRGIVALLGPESVGPVGPRRIGQSYPRVTDLRRQRCRQKWSLTIGKDREQVVTCWPAAAVGRGAIWRAVGLAQPGNERLINAGLNCMLLFPLDWVYGILLYRVHQLMDEQMPC